MKLFGRMPKGWIFLWLVLCLSLLALLGGCERLPWSKLSSGRECLQFELPEVPATSLVTGSESESVRQGLLYFTDCENVSWSQFTDRFPFRKRLSGIRWSSCSPPRSSRRIGLPGLQFVLQRLAILGIAVNEGLARVDFSAPILSYTPEEERLVLGSLLCTLRQFPRLSAYKSWLKGWKSNNFRAGPPARFPSARNVGLTWR